MTLKVYLAGPITGQSYDGATDWRREAILRYKDYGIEGLSPLRGKDYLKGLEHLPHTVDQPLSTEKGITTRDRWDCTRADLLLVNFEDEFSKRLDERSQERVSIGTCMEIAWADSQRIPIVINMVPGSVHDHPMIRACAGFIVRSFEEALELSIVILGKEKIR